MQKFKKFIPIGLALTPFLAMGATFGTIVTELNSIVVAIIPVLIGIAVIMFMVGVIKYITAGGDEEKRKEARNVMIYGIIGLFVIIAVWGLVNLIASTFSIDVGGTIKRPTLPQ